MSGIPRAQIAAIGDADTDAKKQALFERVRQGQVRVLIGSTTKSASETRIPPQTIRAVPDYRGRVARGGAEKLEQMRLF